MKTVLQRATQKRNNPVAGMLVVLVSICAFLAFLAAVTALVHFIAM